MSVSIFHRHFVGQSQFQEFVNRIQDMCTPITQTAHSKIVPAAPLSQMVVFVIFVIRSYSQPGIPLHVFRQLLAGRELIDIGIPFVPATGIIHVCRHSRYILDNTGIHPRLELKIVSFRMSLVTDLCSQVRTFQCSLHQQFSFIESTCQRFLHIHMFT